MHVDLLITNIARLLTCAAPHGALRGTALREAQIIENAAIAIMDGRIVALGTTEHLHDYTAITVFNATGLIAMPGFVDPHTHVCYAGDRADEFALRIAGATYQELMAAGGGIMSTVRATRAASRAELVAQTRTRLDRMLKHGTTTVEIKTGYGLDVAHEIAMLEALAELEQSHRISIVPTFIGAHAIPAEYRGNAEGYTQLVIDKMLPAVAEWWRTQTVWQEDLACDVFCEEGAFDLSQSRLILERAKELGFSTKLHVDEFAPLGGTPLAVELGSLSADHLVSTPPEHVEQLAQSNTVAVALPGTPFGLGHHHFTPARAIVDAGGALALATDCNPGTSICESMPFIIALACRYLRLTPTEAIHAATINAAHALNRAHEVGSLEVGKMADIVLFDLPSEQHVGYRFGTVQPYTVFKCGEEVN